MLDLLEALGIDFDGADRTISVRLHGFLFRNHKPQSLCAFLVHRGNRKLVRLIGREHCLRSYKRYY
jgi:hypothetical protein